MQCIDPWSPVIFKDSFTNVDFESVKRKIDLVLDNPQHINSDHQRGDSVSSVYNSKSTGDAPHKWVEFDEFKKWSVSRIEQAINAWQLSVQPYRATTSWINRHNQGGWSEEHNHRGSYFVAVYYIEAPENCGRLLVRDPMEYHWGYIPSVMRGIDDIWYPIEVKTGDFLLFPSWLWHKTEPNLSNKTRYVMSINYEGAGWGTQQVANK